MKNEMRANMQAFRSDMRALRGETQRMELGLQAGTKGIMAIACDETTEHKMAVPCAGANELRENVDCVGPAVETGEDKIIRETCWTRLVTVEKVTITEREKVNGVTEMCMRRVETREIMNEVTEITETPEIEGEVKETKDEHTHTHGVNEGQ